MTEHNNTPSRNRPPRVAGLRSIRLLLAIAVIAAVGTTMWLLTAGWSFQTARQQDNLLNARAADSDAPAQPPPPAAAIDPRCEAAYNWAKNDEAADYAITAFGNANPRPNLSLLGGLRGGHLIELRPEHCLILEDRRLLKQECGQYGLMKPTQCLRPHNTDNRWVMELYIEPRGAINSGIHLLLCSRDGLIAWSLPQPEDRTERCLLRLTAAHLRQTSPPNPE